MRTDAQIERDVLEELGSDFELTDAAVAATVEAGIVRLSGTAPTFVARVAAHRAVERIVGVRAILDDVVVEPPPHLYRTDGEIRRAITAALELNVQIPRRSILFSVSGGQVLLDGAVEHQSDRAAAENAIAVLAGVRGILNRIRVEPSLAPNGSTTLRIERALRRSAELDSKNILVEAAPDGEVYLRGTVRSWAELHDAERAAWSAPGVRDVVNRLAVVL